MKSLARMLEWRLLAGVHRERITPGVYASMVDSLYGTLVGYAALGGASMILALLSFIAKPGLATSAMLAAMTTITALRIALMIAYHQRDHSRPMSKREAVRWEAAYAVIGVVMMAIIGLICAYAVDQEESALTLVVSVIVVMGVSGCIAGRNGSRPKIVSYQIAVLYGPFVAALVLEHTKISLIIAALVVVSYFATMSSTNSVYGTLRTALMNEAHNRKLTLRVRRSADLFDTALNNMTCGLLLFDRERRLVVANDRVKMIMGRQLIESMMGRPSYDISHDMYAAYGIGEREAKTITATFRRAMDDNSEVAFPVHDYVRDRVFEFRLKTIRDQGAVMNVDDVTEKRAKNQEIFRLAHNDDLTGLPNRFSLANHLEDRLAETGEQHCDVLMYIDLDRFKEVNDDLGHAAGDAVLIQVAKRLQACCRPIDFAARIAGDEFVIVFSDISDMAKTKRAAERIIRSISRPYVINGKAIEIGASAGLSSTYGLSDPVELLRIADVALYEAKTRGRGIAIWYDRVMDERARTRRELTSQLREAVDNDALELHYQPIVDFRSGRVVACEALARWRHPVDGLIPPSVFIPLAEESDLIHKLGLWSLTRACRDASAWPDESTKVAVNLSASQFQYGSISATIVEILAQTGLPADRLEVEITESVLANDLDAMKMEMDALSQAGVSIALDDFGTGFSSLSFLHKLPIDKFKLDRSFVTKLDEDASAVSLVASIVQMALTMRKMIVIEGVETLEQLMLVAAAQGRLVQGFFFSRALCQADLLRFLKRNVDDSGADLRAKVTDLQVLTPRRVKTAT
jgi:diguanylate cyclase (GGDEF)-like protein